MRVLPGCHVRLRYTLTDEAGQVLYQSEDDVEFTVGEGEVLPAFEEAIMEMEVGEQRVFTLEPEEAFGPYQPEWVFRLSRHQVVGNAEVVPGQMLQLSTPDGEVLPVYVISADEETIEVDANHPLAGKRLTYYVEILRVE